MTLHEHTQIGHVIIWSLLAIILIASGGFAGLSHREIPLVVSIILLVYLVLFYKLRITIEDETLRASFGPDIIRKKVRRRLSDASPFPFVGGMAGHSSHAVRLAL